MNKNERVERLREKLYKAIDEEGISSAAVYKISQKIDKLVNEQYSREIAYPENSIIKENYYLCMEIIKRLTKEFGGFPTVKSWNHYAEANNLLSNISIEYISGMNWSKLEKYIKKEIK